MYNLYILLHASDDFWRESGLHVGLMVSWNNRTSHTSILFPSEALQHVTFVLISYNFEFPEADQISHQYRSNIGLLFASTQTVQFEMWSDRHSYQTTRRSQWTVELLKHSCDTVTQPGNSTWTLIMHKLMSANILSSSYVGLHTRQAYRLASFFYCLSLVPPEEPFVPHAQLEQVQPLPHLHPEPSHPACKQYGRWVTCNHFCLMQNKATALNTTTVPMTNPLSFFGV
jgi:hypothetical protein